MAKESPLAVQRGDQAQLAPSAFAQAMGSILKATGAKKGSGDGQEITVQLDQRGPQVVLGVISATPTSGVLDCIALGKKVLADVQAVR